MTIQLVSNPDPRDYHAVFDASALPASTNNRAVWDANIKPKDQAQQGDCVGFGTAYLAEILRGMRAPYIERSTQFPYNVCLAAEDRVGQDGVFSARDMFECARKVGIPRESLFPYGGADISATPPQAAFDDAALCKIKRYEFLPLNLSGLNYIQPVPDISVGMANIKAAIAKGMPVVFTMSVGMLLTQQAGALELQNYRPVSRPFMVNQLGERTETGNDRLGGHCLVGVDYTPQYCIALGAWGLEHGETGRYYALPWQCVQDMGEAIIIRAFEDMSFEDAAEYAARHQVVTAYVACLNRAPDSAGLIYWAGGGLDDGPLYDALLASDEGRALHASPGAALAAALSDENMARFQNCVTVAAYCSLDLGCDVAACYNHALDLVTADPASVDAAKFWIRQHVGGVYGAL